MEYVMQQDQRICSMAASILGDSTYWLALNTTRVEAKANRFTIKGEKGLVPRNTCRRKIAKASTKKQRISRVNTFDFI